MKESLSEQLGKLLNHPVKTSSKQKNASFDTMRENLISKGSVVYLPLTEKEGLVITSGYETHNKFVVIIGELPDGTIVGSLLINTHANAGSEKVNKCQYPLKKETYSWLDYSSWLDCSRIVTIARDKVLSGKYCGKLLEYDLGLVIQCMKDTTLISNKIKKKYGIPVSDTQQ